MSKEVKRFYAEDPLTEYANGRRGQILCVPASDYDALLAERDSMRDTLEHIRDTIDGQLTLIAQRAPGKYLDKTPIVRCLRLHRTRADEALTALQGAQP